MATLIEKSACFIVSGVAVAATAMMIWPEPRINLGIEMATIDQKERYRQRAALCYEIAATLSGDTATSMRRLGNSYAELAEDSDRPRTGIFVPTKRHEVPHCATCGNEMRFTYSLRRTETLQAMQGFHCDRCRKTVIWKER